MANALNKAQKQAVEYTDGPLIIVAGAGTGKTTVITQKIVYLIEKELAKPEEILALTFTDKAATEMVERVDKMIDIGYVDLQISTFHSFCQKILERHAIDIGLSNHFKLLTETDAWMLMRKNLDKFDLDYYRPLGSPAGHIRELIAHFSKCKDELVTPEEYLEHADGVKMDRDNMNVDEKSRLAEIANAYHAYNKLLLDNAMLDFGDLIFYTIKLLQTKPNILNALQKRFKYILVDEFQDVNWSQYQLVRLLAGKNSKLTVVGDDDQSIYAFRGASVSNILRFKTDFPDAKEIILSVNYRSGQKILDYAYKLIQNNNPDRLEVKLKVNKSLKSNVKQKGEVIHIHCATIDEEVKSVVDEIIKIKNSRDDVVFDDFAILVRANNHSEPFISALEKSGVPYEFLAASGLYRQPIVLDCLNFFRILDNYHEYSAVYRILRMPVWKFDEHDVQKITFAVRRKNVSCYEALRRAQEFGVSKTGLEIIQKILSLIMDGIQQQRTQKPTVVLYQFLEKSGYLSLLAREEEQGNREVIRQIYQLKQLFEYVSSYEAYTPGAHVAGFVEHYNYILESGDRGSLYQPSDTPDSVNILTAHKSKGLEFKYVFVVNLVEDGFPARRHGESLEIPAELIKEQLPEGDSHFQEERRLFYVAMTRAKERLYLLSSDDYGGMRTKKISRFLRELGFVASDASVEIKRNSAIIKSSPTAAVKGEFIYELPKSFSFSQINSYNTCPYQYKLAHVLQIPPKGNASFSFGQSIHSTMQKFYERVQELNKIQQSALFGLPPSDVSPASVKAPSFAELLSFYDKSWIDDWYSSKNQKEEYYNNGKDILKIFYETHEESWTIPVALEGWFKIKIGNYLIGGRIDRIDKLPDGALEIIDYKTGKSKEKVEGSDKDQLLIYQIAANELPEYKAIGIPNKLTYFYINDNAKVSFFGKDKEIEALKNKLVGIMDKIYSRDFTPKPSHHVCGRCDFKEICEHRNI